MVLEPSSHLYYKRKKMKKKKKKHSVTKPKNKINLSERVLNCFIYLSFTVKTKAQFGM